MSSITLLLPDEPACLDTQKFSVLCQSAGPPHAEEVICRRMEEIAALLTGVERAWRGADWISLGERLGALQAIGGDIGMSAMTQRCTTVLDSLETGDPNAVAATVARLIRTGERSLIEVWDRHGVSY